MTRYFAKEFFEEVGGILRADSRWMKRAAEFNAPILLVCTDKTSAILLDIRVGTFTAREVPSDTPALFRLVADYATWVGAANDGDIGPQVRAKRMRIEGPMSRFPDFVRVMKGVTAVARSLPKEY